MAQINIPDSGIWSTIASALNTMFSEIFGRTGWAQYNDTQYTSGSPFVVSTGTQVVLPNNAGSVLDPQTPTDMTTMYGSSKLLPAASGDKYDTRVTFTAYSSVNDGGFNIKLDISAAGDGSSVITTIPVRMIKGSGVNNAQGYSVNLKYYSLDTFLANGGTVLIEAVDGDITLHSVSYVIERTHKAR